MKKLTAILLAVIMTMCLTVPAFAAAAPEGGGSIGIIGGADGPTSIITSGPIGLEDFKWDGLDLEGLDLVDSAGWVELEKQFQERHQQLIDQQKAALGGVPGQIGVTLNGTYIQFPDAVPEVANGSTMVPVRALVEALDGEAGFEDGKVICKLDGVTITFTPGSAEALVEYTGGELPGDGQMFPLASALYIKGGRTYVPVRFIGETLGYEVGWDNDFKTAIYLDRDGLAEDWNQNFTILNRALAGSSAMEEGKNYRFDLKGGVTFTAFDTINGNQTYQADLTAKELMNTEAASGSASLNVSGALLDLLAAKSGLGEDESQVIQAVADALKKFEFVMNKDGLMWVHSDGLDKVSGEKNVWAGVDLGMEMAAAFAGGETLTVGKLLAGPIDENTVTDCSMVAGMAQNLAAIYGDDKFTTSGGTSTLTIDLDTLDTLEPDVKDLFKELKLTLKVDQKGAVTTTCRMETKAQSSLPAMRLTMDCASSAQKAVLTLDLHIANIGQVKLTMTATQQTTGEKPMTEPPAGANIVEAPELLNP